KKVPFLQLKRSAHRAAEVGDGRSAEAARELVEAGVAVQVALEPRDDRAGERRVDRLREEVAGARELDVALRPTDAVVERDRVLVHRRDRVRLPADDHDGFGYLGPRGVLVPGRDRDAGLDQTARVGRERLERSAAAHGVPG